MNEKPNQNSLIPRYSIFLISAIALCYEILLMRLFSIVQWHHFAYMIISLALLGYGASGTFLAIFRNSLFKQFSPAFIANLSLFSLSIVPGTVILAGYREDVPEIIAASDAVVLPSDRFEGVPQVILQAMAMERPVIASPIGGIPEVVHPENTGILCPVGDVVAYADALARIAGDPSLGKRLGRAGRKLVLDRYTVVAMCERTEAFYSRLSIPGRYSRHGEH